MKRINICEMSGYIESVRDSQVLTLIGKNVLDAILYGMGRETYFYNNLVAYAYANEKSKTSDSKFEQEIWQHTNNVLLRELIIDIQRYLEEQRVYFEVFHCGRNEANAQVFYPGNDARIKEVVIIGLSYLVDHLYGDND